MTTGKTMSLDQLRNRLQDRISILTDRLRHIDKARDNKNFHNVKSDLTAQQVRLQKLEEKIGALK